MKFMSCVKDDWDVSVYATGVRVFGWTVRGANLSLSFDILQFH